MLPGAYPPSFGAPVKTTPEHSVSEENPIAVQDFSGQISPSKPSWIRMIFQVHLRKAHFNAARNYSVEARSSAATSADPDATDIRHCTVMVNTLLVIPFSVAVTFVVAPEVAVELTAPVPLAMVAITAVLLLVQLTWLVTSCCVELPLKVPIAVKTTV
jgi:hypothetical protein